MPEPTRYKPRKVSKWNAEHAKQWRQMRKKGMKLREIAEATGAHVCTIQRMLTEQLWE